MTKGQTLGCDANSGFMAGFNLSRLQRNSKARVYTSKEPSKSVSLQNIAEENSVTQITYN